MKVNLLIKVIKVFMKKQNKQIVLELIKINKLIKKLDTDY